MALRLQVSVHTLMVAMDCRTRLAGRFANMRDTGEPQPGNFISALCGTWGHKAAAAWLSGDNWEDALAPYEQLSDELLIREDRRGYKNLYKIVAEVVERYTPLSKLPFELLTPATTEVSFVAPLGEIVDDSNKKRVTIPVDLIGYIDKLVQDKRTGLKMPLDHKFTGKLDAPFIGKFTEYDPQMTAYMLASEIVLGERVGDAWVNAVETSMVPSSDRKCPKHGVQYEECGNEHVKQTFIACRRTPAQLEEFRARALDISRRFVLPVAKVVAKKGAKAMLTAPRDGPYTGACDYCEYRRWCLTANRAPASMATMLAASVYETDETRLRSGFVEV